jgi:hypothetical protein
VRDALHAIPGARVYADETYADWLLWELPDLRGRVAYDASFEVLSFAQLDATYEFKTVTGPEWLRAARGYRVLVLDTTGSRALVPALRRQAGARVLYRGHGIAVLER